MDEKFWIERWQKGETGFHQAQGNDLLRQHWHALGLNASRSTVFVPLCGKSVDMVWLAGQGHRVVGSELSSLAVADFFRAQGLTPQVRHENAFEIHTVDPITIWLGDFFALPEAAVQDAAAVYDRAALVAMPPAMQAAYVAKLQDLAGAARILLVSLDYPADQIAGPPFATPESQVRALFGPTHEVAVLAVRDGLAASPALKDRGLSWLEEATYLLTPKFCD